MEEKEKKRRDTYLGLFHVSCCCGTNNLFNITSRIQKRKKKNILRARDADASRALAAVATGVSVDIWRVEVDDLGGGRCGGNGGGCWVVGPS
jgi:hypothetical protein